MAKVSKNIKKFRIESKLTQDTLAEKISVTRQTVSSWETGRTQPDVEMLELLSNALGVSIEELIYGEKHKVGLEPRTTDNRKIITVILASLGSLLTVVGLIIMFVVIWEEMPTWVLPTLMFVPLLAGSGFAAFVHTKRSSSVPWREGASAAWVAGLTVTISLILVNSGTYDRGFDLCLILSVVTFLIFFVALITKSLTGIVSFLISIVWWSILMLVENRSFYVWLFGSLILHACGFVCTTLASRNDIRKISFIVNVLACAFTIGFVCSYFSDNPVTAAVCFIVTFLIAVYATDSDTDSAYHFRTVTVPLLMVFSSVISFEPNLFSDGSGVITFAEPLPWVMLAVLAAGVYIGRNSFSKNPLKISFCISSIVSVLAQIAFSYAEELSYTDEGTLKYFLYDFLAAVAILAASASSIALIIKGVKTAKMSIVNFGLIALFSVIISALIKMDFDLIVYGIACVIMGAVLLAINNHMSKIFKAKEEDGNA